MAMPTPEEAEKEVRWHCGFCLTHSNIGHCVKLCKEIRKKKAKEKQSLLLCLFLDT